MFSLAEMKEKVTDLEMQWKNYLNVVEGNSQLKEGSKVSAIVKLGKRMALPNRRSVHPSLGNTCQNVWKHTYPLLPARVTSTELAFKS